PGSDRAYIERNAIGLLSRTNLLSPRSLSWLGLTSPEWRIAASGLWNLSHLFVRPDAAFLQVMSHYVDATIAGDTSVHSIAPRPIKSGCVRTLSQPDLFGLRGDDEGRKPKKAR